MRVVLDAGHGPDTAGKRTPDGTLREFHFNVPVAQYAADLLKQYEEVEVMFTHEQGSDVPLSTRTNKANAWGADLFVSIHANAAGDGGWSSARGIETYVHTNRPAAAVALANAVQRQLIKATNLADRGVKSANFQVLRETKMTAVLVECGFMTNREEAALLKSDGFRKVCAAAIVAGIEETYGLKLKVQPTAEKPTGPADILGHWAEAEIRQAIAAGRLEGYPDGTFKPDEPLTRAQLAVILSRL